MTSETSLSYYRHVVESYALEPVETVSCCFCIRDGEYASYTRGEAVLAGPEHPPYDGNANYICLDHLTADTVIYDGVAGPGLFNGSGKHLISREEYASYAPIKTGDLS